VLLISIDTLRADHLHCYGYVRQTSPNLDELAAEGVLFENHISSTSWTLPAHATLFTGLADTVHGCTDTDRRLPESVTTLAERFAAAGYQTAGFFSGPYLHPAFGLAQGFACYEDCTSCAAVTSAPVESWAMDPDLMRRSQADVTSPRVYQAVKHWLDQRDGRPFFLFVHLFDPHYDFIPPAPYDRKFDPDYSGPITGKGFFFDPAINAGMPRRDLEHLLALYDGEIAWTDEHVARIIADLRQAALLDQTVVAVTSDHGTEFFEHNDKGHRKTLFEEVIRVPLIVRYPRVLPAGRRIAAQTRAIDVAPTLLALAGLPAPPAELMGHPLVELALGGRPDFDNTAVSELFAVGKRMRTMRRPDQWKFYDIEHAQRRYFLNLAEDPRETQPKMAFDQGIGRELAVQYAELLKVLAQWRQRIAAQASPTELPEEVRRKLESLGYIGQQKE